MKYSKTALKELTARYRDVLKKCAFLNAVILLGAALASPAMADYQGGHFITENTLYEGQNVSGLTFLTAEAEQIRPAASEGGNPSFGGWAFVNRPATLTVKNSAYSSSTFDGSGTIFATRIPSGNDKASLDITGTTFTDNHAARDGGAIGNFNELTIKDSIFTNNTALLAKDGEGKYTVAIESDTPVGGGALALGAVSATNVKATSIQKTLFQGNASGLNGGAIGTRLASDANNSAAKLDIAATFEGNTALEKGGAIYNTFYADNGLGKGDGVTVTGVFKENTAEIAGGAIFNDGAVDAAGNAGGVMTIYDSTFTLNEAKGTPEYWGLGGAIGNTGTMTVTNSTFGGVDAEGVSLGNTAEMAGAIYNEGKLTVEGTNFRNNESLVYGGAVYNAGQMSVTGGTFEDNVTGEVGGAIATNTDTTSTLSVENVTFKNNHSILDGGAIGNYSGLTVKNSTFIGNTADYKTDSDGNYTVVVTEDAKPVGGGAIALGAISSTSVGTISGTTFDSNKSGTNGGAIGTRLAANADNSAAKLDIAATFKNNAAVGKGGAIYNSFYSNNGLDKGDGVTVTGSFLSNAADKGGAIYNDGTVDKGGNAGGVMTVYDADFTSNAATTAGGAVYNTGTLTVAANTKNVAFSGNTAAGEANDIYNAGTLNLNADAGRTISLGGGIDGLAGTLYIGGTGTVDVAGALKNQTATVSSGELILSNGAADGSNLTGSNVTVASGATINTIDSLVNDYTGKINLASGSNIKGDIDFLAGTADKYNSAAGEVTYKVGNLIGDLGKGSKTIQVADEGTKIVGLSEAKWTSKSGASFDSTNAYDGKIIVKGFEGGISDAADESEEIKNTNYQITENETVDTAATLNNNFVLDGAGTGDSDKGVTLNANLTADAGANVELNELKLEGTGKYVNSAGALTKVKNSKIDVDVDSAGTWESDPTTYSGTVTVSGTSSFDEDTFTGTATLNNKGAAYLMRGTTFETSTTGSGITGAGTTVLASGITHFNNTASENTVRVAQGATFDGTLANTTNGVLDTRNAAIDAGLGTVTGGKVYIDADLTANKVDTFAAGATVNKINLINSEYGSTNTVDLNLGGNTLASGATFSGGYYTKMKNNGTTVTFYDKLMNTSGTHALLGDWAAGNNLAASSTYDSTTASYTAAGQTVGQALTALDTAIGDVDTLNTGIAGYTGKEVVGAIKQLSSNLTNGTVDANFKTLTTVGNASVGGNLAVTGTTTLTGALTANGAVTLGDAAADAIAVKGTATFDEQIAATKGIKAGTNTTLVDGTLTVSDGTAANTSTLTKNTLTTTTVNATTVNAGANGTALADNSLTLADASSHSTVLSAVTDGATGSLLNVSTGMKVNGNEIVTGDLSVTGLTTFGTAGFKLGGKTVTTVDTDGSNAASSVAKATRQATLATAETVYAGAKNASYNTTKTDNIAANSTIGGAIDALDQAIGNRNYADTTAYPTAPTYLTANETVAASLVALDGVLTDTNKVLGAPQTTAVSGGLFDGEKIGTTIDVITALDTLGLNAVSLSADNVFTGANTFRNVAGISIQDGFGTDSNAVTLKATDAGLDIGQTVVAPGFQIGTNKVTSIDTAGTIKGTSADDLAMATVATVNLGAEKAVFTLPTTAPESLGGATTINTAIVNVASATDTNKANITALTNDKVDKTSIVTAWSSSTSDTKVASEKLVKASLDALDTAKANLTGGNEFTGTQTMTNTKSDSTAATALSVTAKNATETNSLVVSTNDVRVTANGTSGNHSLVVASDGVKVDGSNVLTGADVINDWTAATTTNVASASLVKTALDTKVNNDGNFKAATDSNLIKNESVVDAIRNTAAQVDTNKDAIDTINANITVTAAQEAATSYLTAGANVAGNLVALDDQVTQNAADIGNIQADITVAANGNYILAGSDVAGNLGALDTQVKTNETNIAANTSAISTINSNITVAADGNYITAGANVAGNLGALDNQVKANTVAIAASSAIIGAPKDLTAGGVFAAGTTIGGTDPTKNVSLADAVDTLSQAFTNGAVDANFNTVTAANGVTVDANNKLTSAGLTASSATLTSTEAATGVAATAFTANAENTTDKTSTLVNVTSDAFTAKATDTSTGKSTEVKVTSDSLKLSQQGNTVNLGVIKDSSVGNILTVDANASFGGAIKVKDGISVDNGTKEVFLVNENGAIEKSTGITVKGTDGSNTFVVAQDGTVTAAKGITAGASGFQVNATGAITKANGITSQNKLTVTTGGADITGTTELDTLKFAGTETATAIAAAGLARSTAGVTTTLATTKMVTDTIATQAQDATYTNTITTGSNITGTTLQLALQGLDEAIGNRKTLNTANGNLTSNEAVVSSLNALDNAIGNTTYVNNAAVSYAPIAAKTDLTTAVSQVASNIGAAATGTKGNITAGATVNANLDALDVAIGDKAYVNNKAVSYAAITSGTDLTTAVSQVASNIGAAATGAKGNITAGATVNANLDALDVAIGDRATGYNTANGNLTANDTVVASLNALDATMGNVKALDGTDATGPKGNLAAANSTVADHLTAIDNRMGQITGLYDGTAVNSTTITSTVNGHSNLAVGTTVEDHLVSIDNAIGDRAQFDSTRYLNSSMSTADAMVALDANLNLTEARVRRVEKEMRGGFASMAALSALVPNARGAGDTQLSVGTGVYRDHQGIAVGAFHYFNDNVLANMGLSYGGDKSTVFRAGVTFGW